MKRRSHFKPFSVRRSDKKAKQRLLLSIVVIAIFGFALISWILPTFIGGLAVLNQFKAPTKSEEPIEDTSIAPPVLNIPYEATNSASINIKGYAQPDYSVEIYIDDELKSTVKAREDGSFTSDLVELNIGTNSISGKTVNLESKSSLPSKPIRIVYDNDKPSLEIGSPTDNLETKDKRLTISGSTNPQEPIEVRINNFRAIVQSDGSFSYSLELNDGENMITISASDRAGNTTQLSRRVVYQP